MYETIIGTFFFAFCLVGCNTIVITHTQGQASDVVDSSPSLEASVDTDLSPVLDMSPKP